MATNPANLYNVKKLVVLITGGGTGMGAAMARCLDLNGAAKVYITGRRSDKLVEVAKSATRGNIVPVQGDVTSRVDLERLTSQIEAEVGYLNVLINNAGGPGSTNPGYNPAEPPSLKELRNMLWSHATEDYEKTVRVNLLGPLLSTSACLELLDAGNRKGNVVSQSQIITVSSTSAYWRSIANGIDYMSAKAGIVAAMKTLATVFTPYGIRSNILVPGVIETEFNIENLRTLWKGAVPFSLSPQRRLGTLDEVAATTLYMCSPASRFCNGSVQMMDGGRLSVNPGLY